MESTLIGFTRQALEKGLRKDDIETALSKAGWARDEIATVTDGFADSDLAAVFNGEPAVVAS